MKHPLDECFRGGPEGAATLLLVLSIATPSGATRQALLGRMAHAKGVMQLRATLLRTVLRVKACGKRGNVGKKGSSQDQFSTPNPEVC